VAEATAVWLAALGPEGDPLFPPDTLEALRAADVRWADEPAPVPPVATTGIAAGAGGS
jgi:hypothetical protein